MLKSLFISAILLSTSLVASDQLIIHEVTMGDFLTKTEAQKEINKLHIQDANFKIATFTTMKDEVHYQLYKTGFINHTSAQDFIDHFGLTLFAVTIQERVPE